MRVYGPVISRNVLHTIIFSVIDSTARGHHPDRSGAVADQTQGFAGRTHSDLDLGADCHPFDVPGEDAREERIALVPAVESHFLPKEARGDSEPNAGRHRGRISSSAGL